MEGQEGMDPAAGDGRWTCDACGCRTNQAGSRACSICGTRQIPAFLRRAGRTAASRLLANHYNFAAGNMEDDEIFDADGLEIHFGEGMMGLDPEEQDVAALALEVAGVAGAARIPGAHSLLSRRQRFPNAPAPPEEDRNLPPPEPPETLWQLAMENAASYQPKWTTSHRGGRARHGHDVELGNGQLQNVARIADGAGEGRAVRAAEPLPRAPHRSRNNRSESAAQGDSQRKVFGFRVVFDHPYREPGTSLGDCYLVGVTTSSFSAYGERNGLLQSSYFWGVEDGGSQFEGARRRRVARPASSAYGIEMGSRGAPRNPDNALFGARETVSVVVDLDNRSMSFWREGNFLGTLVRNLPRSGHLYPVVVPFNSGVSFAITGMDGSPLPCVESFNSSRRERENQKARRRQQELAESRALVVENGSLSTGLIGVLKKIFYQYTGLDEEIASSLGILAASRLWYRSGLSLTGLCELLETKVCESPGTALHDNVIALNDYVDCITQAVNDDMDVSFHGEENGRGVLQGGDKVELVDSYAKFGTVKGGPLLPGDRGTVVELKEGPNGEPLAVLVSFNGRQWFYEPQALLSERTGLIESTSVWFLHRVLRSHGYDQKTLEPLWGKPLTKTSWEVGDLVTPRVSTGDVDPSATSRDCFGRIVSETNDPPSSAHHRGHKASTVLVEFAEPSFGIATGVLSRASETTSTSLLVRCVPIDKLQHAAEGFYRVDTGKNDFDSINQSLSEARLHTELSDSDPGLIAGEQCDQADVPLATTVFVSSKLRSEIEGVSCLDPTSILSVARACEKQPSLSTGLFASGLSDAIISGASLAEQSVAQGKINERMRAAVSLLGFLSGILCDHLLPSGDGLESATEEVKESAQGEGNALSSVLAEAARVGSSFPQEDMPSESVRSELLDPRAARRMMLAGAAMSAARQRAQSLRARARRMNSTSSLSSREDWNVDGQSHVDARSLIFNALVMNRPTWLKACLRSMQDKATLIASSSAKISNSRDEHGMSLLMLSIALGCSTEIVRHLVLAEAVVGTAEIKAAALSNQPHLLSVLLQNSICPEQVLDLSLLAPDVIAVFKAAEARQKSQEQILRKKADVFAATLVFKLCRLVRACRSGPLRLRRVGRAASEALVGNVLLRALHESQQKALAAASPRRRKHGGSHTVSDIDSERLSITDPWGSGESDVSASAAAMSPKHGVLLVLPDQFCSEGFLCGPPETQRDRLGALLSAIESLLWSKEKEDVAAGLTVLQFLLENVLVGVSSEIARYGMADLVLTHELVAGRQLADLKNRQKRTTAIDSSEGPVDGSRSNKKRPRPHLVSNSLAAGDVVLCPKLHVAELHLTKHSSFRCDICGKGVLRDRPMHGCRECDWDACESCTDQAEGGVVKWGHILDLAVRCRKLLDNTSGALKSSNSLDGMKVEQSMDDSKLGDSHLDFHMLVRQLRTGDESVLSSLASKMESDDKMTNHEFVTFILPALHTALVPTQGASTPNDQFIRKALEAFTDFVEGAQPSEARGDEDSHMSIDDMPGQGDDASMEGNSRHAKPSEVKESRSCALRRLQDILAFSENMRVRTASQIGRDGKASSPSTGSSLQSLILPIELQFFGVGDHLPVSDLTLSAEPLLPSRELELHVIRVCRIRDPSYLEFCSSLARDNAVIIERVARLGSEAPPSWQIAEIFGFDEKSGSHYVRYPSKLLEDEVTRNDSGTPAISLDRIKFDGRRSRLMLAARDYCIIRRGENKSVRWGKLEKRTSSQQGPGQENDDSLPAEIVPTGTRVEANCLSSDGAWLPCTVVSRSSGRSEVRYDVVSDRGEVFGEVRADQLRGYQRSSTASGADGDVARNLRDALDPEPPRNANRRGGALPFPFFRMGRHVADPRSVGQRHPDPGTPRTGVLKRTWSALSPVNEMSPVDIPLDLEETLFRNDNVSNARRSRSWRCSIDEEGVDVLWKDAVVELPPEIWVEFSAHEKLPTVDVSARDGETVVQMLHRLLQRHDETKSEGCQMLRKHELYYNVQCSVNRDKKASFDVESDVMWKTRSRREEAVTFARGITASRATLSPSMAVGSLEASARYPEAVDGCSGSDVLGISEWLDDTSLRCMEVLNVLGVCAEQNTLLATEESTMPEESPEQRDKFGQVLSAFENESLSQKLRDQLEDPLLVVGGLLPDWCLTAPSIAPRVFSYAARRQLLLRTAFGVSRSTLRQQDAKVAVGPLRQRMSVLRGRAVELMGEAFSGEAEDPTVLQLQADELYGMEEALAARVSAAFRAQGWDERALQCAKAVVRRERLLFDAATLMERYASCDRLCHRRLEVRFAGESGFDAASGTEAGVTRGFYADVAEALLSSDHVATLHCLPTCLGDVTGQAFGESLLKGSYDLSSAQCRLPIWIPDMDSSHQVVIPTPRASPNSTLGVYPRPLSPGDPFLPLVREQFRFMGRLFAAAMRDGLMFPLQLSASFLKLVQSAIDDSHLRAAALSISECKPMSSHHGGSLSTRCTRAAALSSDDLPRPGFLGGEVYAVELHICAALDRIDNAEPPISPFEADAQRQRIASDPQFARLALGKSYDCSFNDYFEDRTFVDPLSPTQGEDAVPLCADGHLRQVNINNVREWVQLAKQFILHDGVTEQALAFKRGVDDFFPSDYLRIFTAHELQRDVCGGGDKVDKWTEDDIKGLFKYDGGRGVTEALVAVAAMGGEGGATLNRRFGPSSPTIGYLVRTLLESTPTQRRQFLSFVTSVPIVTPGKIEVVPVVSPAGEFLPMRDPGCMPRANTCARRLYLPRFDDYESFSQVLRAVIREESKFKGFYEWRG